MDGLWSSVVLVLYQRLRTSRGGGGVGYTRVCITAQAWIGARSLLSRTFGQLCGTALLLLAAALLLLSFNNARCCLIY